MIKLMSVFALALAVLLPGGADAYSTAGGAGAAPIKPMRPVLYAPKGWDATRAPRCHREKPPSSRTYRRPPAVRLYGR